MAKNQNPATPPVASEAAPVEQPAAQENPATPEVDEAAVAAVKVRVLVDCAFGKPDDVVELDAPLLAQAKAYGQVDDQPEAVAYAESLK